MAVIKFRGTLVREMTRTVEWEIDAEEFEEWASGREPTGTLIKDFIEAGRDFDQVTDDMWDQGTDAPDRIAPFTELHEVEDIEVEQ